MRQIILDTETTGLEASEGHNIIEIGCVEMIGRKLTGRTYHRYIKPDREVDQEAIEVHGITNEFLTDKPKFAEIAQEFIEFIDGAELIIHNAAFDVGFIDTEFERNGRSTRVAKLCRVTDSLLLARRKHPGQRNTLDALCKRYGIDNSRRDKHGALLDAELLAEVYIEMNGGRQAALGLSVSAGDESTRSLSTGGSGRLTARSEPLPARLSADERRSHALLVESLGDEAIWSRHYPRES